MSKHVLKFTKENKNGYLSAVSKYYPKKKILYRIDDNDFQKGFIPQPFKDGNNYELIMDLCPYASIKTLPIYHKGRNQGDNIIQDFINDRNVSSKCYNEISFCKLIETTNNLEHVTRRYISFNDKSVFLVIKEQDIIKANQYGVYNTHLPIFDLDKGFLAFGHNKHLMDELNDYFDKWSNRFKDTNAESWNEPVITEEK